ncbi:unnamed protein product [Darwinula stevensoni]|uniref:CDAN1-interacting nuclease 1 n=1 Tax=Darwinula stevensoni TaxID=69355 RepID=A0A7R8X601_9CRUS|nr:unnamed protein product [Darwinula stevensoni]CAG0880708.1 unnamed protein product [Darwinula stevensoni]
MASISRAKYEEVIKVLSQKKLWDLHDIEECFPDIPKATLGSIKAQFNARQTKEEQGQKKKKNKQREKKKVSRLTDLKACQNTARKRLEKKLMNRSSVRRVASAMDAQDKKKFLDKFGNQFNYHIPKATLGSIKAQFNARQTKVSHYKHTHPEAVAEYYKRYVLYLDLRSRNEDPGFLLRMAEDIGFSPAMLARSILQKHLESQENLSGCEPSKKELNRISQNLDLLNDKVLASECYLCFLVDDNYGPIPDGIKHQVGVDYECLLKQTLNKYGIPFQDECALRCEGYDRTPDVKLSIPIAVQDEVVCWVESKALFGDDESHSTYLHDQLKSYLNRYGNGMVIYWFGCVSELQSENKEKGLLIRTTFPSKEEITFLNKTSAEPHIEAPFNGILFPSEKGLHAWLPKDLSIWSQRDSPKN